MSDIHEGGCVCGGVRYRTSGQPTRVSLCACTWCQRRTGSAFGLSVYFLNEDVEITQGELGTYRLTSDAGRWVDQDFCRNCGTSVTWKLEYRPHVRGIAGGTFDQPSFWYRPERFGYARSKPDWLDIPDGLTVFEDVAEWT